MSDLPATMPAAVLVAPGQVEVQDRPVPVPGPDQVVVEVDHCGICGSDIHLLNEGWGQPGLIGGHEFTGTIVALGEAVTGWREGQSIVAGQSPQCGYCRRCREHQPSQCENRGSDIMGMGDGAFARYVLVRAGALLALPDALTPRQAALAEPLAVALHGLTRSGVTSGDSVMIFGVGPIGALALAVLVSRGIGPITVVEPNPLRRGLALELGATEVIEPDDLERFHQAQPEVIAQRAVHVVLECSGHREAMEAGFQQLRRGGRLCLVGAGIEMPSFDPNRMILNELSVCGAYIYDETGFEDALELLASGTIATDRLIDPVSIGLGGISQALAALARGSIVGKVMVVPSLA